MSDNGVGVERYSSECLFTICHGKRSDWNLVIFEHALKIYAFDLRSACVQSQYIHMNAAFAADLATFQASPRSKNAAFKSI